MKVDSEPSAPFFVIGSPRSGTTMLRLMLTCHSRLVVPPECGFIVWLHQEFGIWNGRGASEAAEISRFAEAVLATRKFDTWNLSREEVQKALAYRRPASYAAACDTVYRLFASQSGKPQATWGDKNNYYLAHITTLKTIYPEARFLHIVRDGRDVACSYRETMALESCSRYRPELPLSINDISRKWSNDIRLIQTQLAKLARKDKYEVRYEDIASTPARALASVCDWLGVRFEKTMLDFHQINRTAMLEPRVTMDWKRRTLEPANPGTVGRYVSELTFGEVEAFVAIAEAQLRDYGYID